MLKDTKYAPKAYAQMNANVKDMKKDHKLIF